MIAFLGRNTMLVLSRRIGESIVIDGDIYIKVLDVKGDRIKLGIVAPKEVPIFRTEISEHEENHDVHNR
jgi:carbon storage regulator